MWISGYVIFIALSSAFFARLIKSAPVEFKTGENCK